MSNVYKYLRKSFSGEEKEEKDHDMDVLKISHELAEYYQIVHDEDVFVPHDVNMADAVFSAAIELLTSVGIYCKDTGRTIPVNHEEILRALATPNNLEIGRFKERIKVVNRMMMDCQPPVIIGGPMGGKVSEKNYLNVHISSAIEPIVQGIYAGDMQSIRGVTMRSQSPEEMFVALEEARFQRLATKIAEREGLTLLGPVTPGISQANMLVSSNELYSKNDIQKVKHPGDMKTDFEVFYNSIFHQEHGNNYLSSQYPLLGGESIKTAEGLAIVDVAETIQSRLVTSANLHASGAIDKDTNASSSKDIIWASNISSLAISRNMNHPTARYHWNIAGCCTDMMFYETAAQAIGDTVCGREILIGPVGGRGTKADHSCGLESRFMGDISRLCLKMDLAEANDMVSMFYGKYEDRLADAPEGQGFEECYIVDSKYDMRPKDEYMELYSKIIAEIDECY